MKGFFSKSQLKQTKAPIFQVPRCGACGLAKTCQSPKMPVSGKGKRKILIVGEAPGAEEDKQNKQFVGKTGQLLESTLHQHGIDMRRDCWLTNSLICRPESNATPSELQIAYCRPNLIKSIQELNPEVIIPLGGPAIKSLLGWLWKDNVGGIGRWIGFQIPHQKLNAWICPNWHPSFVAREREKHKVVEVIWNKHFERIAELSGRPWEKVPDYKSEIEIVLNTKEAAKIIRAFIAYGGRSAFDYETNMLKPDWPEADIISASICWEGKRTIAFPWDKHVIEAMTEYIRSDLLKIASNAKFEDRWSRQFLGKPVKNWWHDTMVAAHVHDNRPEITGLKFQSFVWLGAESYDAHIKQFLRTKGDERTNRAIRDIGMKDLLIYNGLDSLLEYHVAMKQREAMGLELCGHGTQTT